MNPRTLGGRDDARRKRHRCCIQVGHRGGENRLGREKWRGLGGDGALRVTGPKALRKGTTGVRRPMSHVTLGQGCEED